MNVTRMTELADLLESSVHPLGCTFDMGTLLRRHGRGFSLDYDDPVIFPRDCGTVGCVAGLAVLKWGIAPVEDIVCTARKILGLTATQAGYLFFAGWRDPAVLNLKDITRAEAAGHIRTMVSTHLAGEATR